MISLINTMNDIHSKHIELSTRIREQLADPCCLPGECAKQVCLCMYEQSDRDSVM